MATPRKKPDVPMLSGEWTLPAAATLGSSVRCKGILLEIRARMPSAMKKSLDIRGAMLVLSMPETQPDEFRKASAIVETTLVGIESLPVIPREIQDILTITTTERHRWLKDGRLKSAGTRTVKLRGRAKKITFHVFDPRLVEDILDRDQVSAWREDDIETRAENRRRAAMARVRKASPVVEPEAPSTEDEGPRPKLRGWEAFEREGLLR